MTDQKERKHSETFKICPNCRKIWTTRSDFLSDPEIRLTGYQVNFRQLEQGLFLFDHLHCRTTMAIRSKSFNDLYHGPVFENSLLGTDSCPAFCLHSGNLEKCSSACECAYVRDVIQTIKDWPKSETVSEMAI